MLENLTEELQMIAEVLEGRVEAFEYLVRKYQRAIYFLVLRLVQRAEEADEITQQAFLKAYKNLKSFRGEASFKTWISRIALNLARNEWKKHKRVFVEYDDQKAKAPEIFSGPVEEEKKNWLQKILTQLPPTQREVVILRIYEEKSFQEIAALMDSKEGTVKVNFHHALKQLKEWWLKKGQ